MNGLGLPASLVHDLFLRRALLEGFSSLIGLSRSLKLSFSVVETVFHHLRTQQWLEVRGMNGNDYNFVLSAAGRSQAVERFQICQYAGPAPVPLSQYHSGVRTQKADVRVDRRILRESLSDLVLSDRLLDQLGPALISQNSIFLYGSSGNGKTSIVERLLRIYRDVILIPHAVEVDGQIVSVFDPVVHHRIEAPDADIDPRWVLCRRPCIIAGGELVPGMLELRLDEVSGIYAAPLQMKANNGVFVIDDFGRQLMSPRDLLNRWIVPLDRRVDYLTLRYGVKFQIPFELMVVFSTNLEPASLVDEAFLRRIPNKVLVEAVDSVAFDVIFERVVSAANLPTEPGSAETLRKLCLAAGSQGLRACLPSDICNLILSISIYEGRPPQVTREDLERAVSTYFARSTHPGGEAFSAILRQDA